MMCETQPNLIEPDLKSKKKISFVQENEFKVLDKWSFMIYELYSTLNIESVRPNVRQMLSNNIPSILSSFY